MESQSFSPKDFSVCPAELMPSDDFEDDDHMQWRDYCRIASTIDRTRILEVVLSDLDADDSPLYEFIDDGITHPHEPGRAKESITARTARAIPPEPHRQGRGRSGQSANGRGGDP